MKYRNFKRFRNKSAFGVQVNIPRYTTLYTNEDGYLIYTYTNTDQPKTVAVCGEKSEYAFTYFMPLLDGEPDELWDEKADLYNAIRSKTSGGADSKKEDCIDEFWHDEVANKYRQISEEADKDAWIWDRYALHHASIQDLRHMWNLIKDI